MKYLLAIISICFSLHLAAQKEIQPITIYTKDGNVLRGQVLTSMPSEWMELQLANGQKITVQHENIQQIHGKNNRYVLLPDGSTFRSKGLYKKLHFQTMYSYSSQNDNDQTVLFGLGSQFSMGYQFNPYLGVGGGMGISYYGYGFGDLHVNVRGDLLKKKISPTYSLDIGYGAPITLIGGNNWNNNSGGLLVRPSVGLRVANIKRSKLLLDAGYAFQEFRGENTGWWGWNEVREGWYRRLSIRIGWMW